MRSTFRSSERSTECSAALPAPPTYRPLPLLLYRPCEAIRSVAEKLASWRSRDSSARSLSETPSAAVLPPRATADGRDGLGAEDTRGTPAPALAGRAYVGSGGSRPRATLRMPSPKPSR